MKSMYPKPEIRTMGDADILIRPEQYDKINPLLLQLGFSFDEAGAYHDIWTSDKLILEAHKRLIGEKYQLLYQYFRNGWHLAIPEQGTRYTMSPEDTFLFLLVHFTKHYIWSGIGCRHVMDLWVYLQKHPQLNETILREKLEIIGLSEFYDNIRSLLAYWFEDGQSSDKLEYMTDFLFSNGSWGTAEKMFIAEADYGVGTHKRNVKVAFFIRKAFPSVKTMSDVYPILKKHPWLLPFTWIARAWKVIVVKRIFLKQMKLIDKTVTRENMESRRKELQFVGLGDGF